MVKTIEDIDVLDAEKRRVPSKHYVYVILVKWSDGTVLTVYRRYSRFFDLQTRLLDRFPIEAGTIDPELRIIPFLPGKIFFGRSHIKDVAMKRLKDINDYCKCLIKLPPQISQCEEVLEFFEVEPDDLEPPSKLQEEGKRKLSLSLSLNSLSKLKGSKDKKAEKISKPKSLERYVATAEYTAQAPGELPLQPGLIVEVSEKSNSGWWFVNSEDQQGWVPSTYLEPESGSDSQEKEGPMAPPGEEENHLCIENFTAASSDEISLEKGAVVQVLQKNMDGWWLVSWRIAQQLVAYFVRYEGKEAYAPGTYLKKASNANIVSMVQKSRLSGVEIISSIQDVSNLLNQDGKSNKEKPALPSNNKNASRLSSSVAPIDKPTAVFKQKSLERGGSLIPPPRQNSVTKMNKSPAVSKVNIYVTAEDFVDTVGDGLSFQKGQKVQVIEKTPTGWWFVQMGDEEGWVPANYLEPYKGPMDMAADIETIDAGEEGASDDDEDDWYADPDHEIGPEIISSTDVHPAKRPLPPVPKEDSKPSAKTASRPLPPAPGDNKQLSSLKQSDTPQKLPLKQAPKPPQKSSPSESAEKLQSSKGKVQAEGSQDLAALLKARFAAKSGTSGDSGNSSDEDSNRTSKPVVPKPESSKPQIPKPASIPSLPIKPSDLKKNGRESGISTPFGAAEKSPFNKPPPPAKVKPLKPPTPSKPGGGDPSPKPAIPSVPTKPPLKPSPSSGIQNNKPSERGNVKGMAAAFSNAQASKPLPSEKPKPVGKPAVTSKPKPVLSAKPGLPSKPSTHGEKSSQGINNLIKSLDNKLSLGHDPKPATETNNRPPSVSSMSQRPSVAPPPVPTQKTSSSTYVAQFDFIAERDGELGLNEGDEVEMLEEEGDWCLVRFWDDEGWVPTAYLEKV